MSSGSPTPRAAVRCHVRRARRGSKSGSGVGRECATDGRTRRDVDQRVLDDAVGHTTDNNGGVIATSTPTSRGRPFSARLPRPTEPTSLATRPAERAVCVGVGSSTATSWEAASTSLEPSNPTPEHGFVRRPPHRGCCSPGSWRAQISLFERRSLGHILRHVLGRNRDAMRADVEKQPRSWTRTAAERPPVPAAGFARR